MLILKIRRGQQILKLGNYISTDLHKKVKFNELKLARQNYGHRTGKYPFESIFLVYVIFI